MVVGGAATAALVSGAAEAQTMETYYYVIVNNPVPGKEREYLTWYDNRHIIDVVAVPGFVSGQRFIRNETQMYANVMPHLPTYLTLYTVRTNNLAAVNADIRNRIQTGVTKFETPSVIQPGTGLGYWYRFNAPEIRRTIPQPASLAGKKLVNYKHMVFMNALEGKQAEWETWYDQTHSPEMLTGPGFLSSQRTTLAVPAPNAAIPPTREMVMFTLQIPEGDTAESARPVFPRSATPSPQDGRATRGYTYREIGPVWTHAAAVAKKATFTA
jgi:antibiotic biosynthesis monooxygenase (ABM) superfamily enzyme